MYAGTDFSEVNAPESVPLTFDFVKDVKSVGVTIVSAVWTCVASTGADASAATRLTGAPTNSGTQSTQTFANGLPGVKYIVACVATMSDGSKLELYSHVPCRAVS